MTPEIRLRYKIKGGVRHWRATLRDADGGGTAPLAVGFEEHLSPAQAVSDLVNTINAMIPRGELPQECQLFPPLTGLKPDRNGR